MNIPVTSDDVARIFLEFFESKQHLKIPGHSLLPDNDPSLLFINSGMAPLKPYFLGQEKPPKPDLCNIQRCIRTNDIEEVGDRHHLTFFEMMGSWSINHYWKPKAIELAWELLTEHFNFPKERLYATVYAGDDTLGIPADEESYRVWRDIGVPEDHIIRLGKDNLWGPAGEFGPCGPCTEVFFDTGDAYGEAYVPGGHFDDVNRYIEIWNAGVFMEFNKLPSGISKLDIRSVDTGSGLERMVMALNGYESCYETDLLKPLMDFSLKELGESDFSSPSARLISDHIRASVMMLGDGIKPGANGAGYIPRRLIRRAVATAAQAGKPEFDFSGLLRVALDNAKSWNTQVTDNRDAITEAFETERAAFEETLEHGLKKLDQVIGQDAGTLDGEQVFNLFSTYGLPVDIIRDVAAKKGKSIDEDGFDAAFKAHQDVSRAGTDGDDAQAAKDWDTSGVPPTEFIGYNHLSGQSAVIALIHNGERVEDVSRADEVTVMVGSTPFYAEGGGQVGDTGKMQHAGGALEVLDTIKTADGIYLHKARVSSGTVRVGDELTLRVDEARRRAVEANHSATHLLHAALRNQLGEDVGQAGSLVDGERLRFDFTYGSKLTDAQLYAIEDEVNAAIRANVVRDEAISSYDAAIESGALAFFGDKYDADVRVIGFDRFSKELCGGCHVPATGTIGYFLIQSEGSVARGVRRIQAITGQAAIDASRAQAERIKALAASINAQPAQLEERVGQLQEKAKAKKQDAPAVSVAGLAKQAQPVRGGVPGIVTIVQDVDPKQLRDVALNLSAEIKGVACLLLAYEDKLKLAVAVHKSATAEHHAGNMLKEMMQRMNGRGGGRDTYAEGVGEASAMTVEAAKELCADLLQ